MLSKAQIKYIRSLSQHKYRNEHQVFVAEGNKIVVEWLKSKKAITTLVATEQWINENNYLFSQHPETEVIPINESILSSISTLQTPQDVLMLAPLPVNSFSIPEKGWYIALDEIQDPGNMGTIIRIADWFGIEMVFCSSGCVDAYNPKVIQAAMGSHLRVSIINTELIQLFQQAKIPAIATVLNGENVYEFQKPKNGIIIIGNEAKGISQEILEVVNYKLTLPRIGGAESLNAGVTAGIFCSLLIG